MKIQLKDDKGFIKMVDLNIHSLNQLIAYRYGSLTFYFRYSHENNTHSYYVYTQVRNPTDRDLGNALLVDRTPRQVGSNSRMTIIPPGQAAGRTLTQATIDAMHFSLRGAPSVEAAGPGVSGNSIGVRGGGGGVAEPLRYGDSIEEIASISNTQYIRMRIPPFDSELP